METRKPKKLFILGEGLQNFFSIPSQKSLIGHFVVHSKSTEEKHRRVNLQFLQTESNVIEQLNLEFDESEEPDESVKIFELKVAKHGHEKFARKVIHDSENDDINGTNDKTPIPKSSGAFENSATIGKNPKLPLVNFIRTVKDAIKEGESANNNIRKEMELLHSIIDQISRKTPEKRNKSVSEIMRSYEKSRNSTLLHGIIVPDHSKSQYPSEFNDISSINSIISSSTYSSLQSMLSEHQLNLISPVPNRNLKRTGLVRNSLNANSKHETGVRLGKLQLKPSHLLPKLPLISAINRREIPQENHLTSGNHELLIKGAVDLAEKPKPRLTSIGVPNHYVRSSNLPTESREDFSRKFESFSTKIDDESEPDFDMLISIEENILCALGDEGFDEYDYPMMLSKAIKTKLENMRKHRTLH